MEEIEKLNAPTTEEINEQDNSGSNEIEVTYNGAGRYPGKFKKSITVRSNAKTEVFRLFIVGDMVEKGVTAADENRE